MARLEIHKFQKVKKTGKGKWNRDVFFKKLISNERQCKQRKLKIEKDKIRLLQNKCDDTVALVDSFIRMKLDLNISLKDVLHFISKYWQIDETHFFGPNLNLEDGLAIRLATDQSHEEILFEIASNKIRMHEYICDIKRLEISETRNQLLYDHSILNIFKQAPHLYTNTELRSFWETHLKYVYYLKHRLELGEGWNQTQTGLNKQLLNFVKQDIKQFLKKYYRVTDAYKIAIMQTEFKLQFVLGCDVAMYILSYV